MIPWGHHAPETVTGGPLQGHQPPAGGQFKDLSRSQGEKYLKKKKIFNLKELFLASLVYVYRQIKVLLAKRDILNQRKALLMFGLKKLRIMVS